MSGKGDTPRPMDIPWDQYAENFDRIFGNTISSHRGKMLSDPEVKQEYDRLGPEFEQYDIEIRNGQTERIQRKDRS